MAFGGGGLECSEVVRIWDGLVGGGTKEFRLRVTDWTGRARVWGRAGQGQLAGRAVVQDSIVQFR